MTKEITTTEWELIRSIRNYRNASPNDEIGNYGFIR